MSISPIDLIIPHSCCSCGDIGTVLCEYCKYDITNERFSQCLVCFGPTGSADNLCAACRRKSEYKKAWCVGLREGALEQVINLYKFHRARAASRVLTLLIDGVLPELPDDIVVVPIPTIAPHVRIRGYGHTELVAKQIAHTRKLAYRPVLQRRTNPVQHGATKQQRALQAAGTFECMSLDGGRYLLVDDVYTTGETLKHAARCLKKAGATEVWTTVISRQPLEK